MEWGGENGAAAGGGASTCILLWSDRRHRVCSVLPSMQQHFTFNEHTLAVELAPPGTEDDMLFDDGELTGEAFDHTGLGRVWPASIVLCRWLAAHPADVEGRRVLELGAGTGLPSLLCAKLNAQQVVATDCTQAVVDRPPRAAAACAAGRHEVACLPWENSETLLAAAASVDMVLLADVVYPMKDQAPLLAALRELLQCKTRHHHPPREHGARPEAACPPGAAPPRAPWSAAG